MSLICHLSTIHCSNRWPRIEQFTSAIEQYRFIDHVTDLSVDKLLLCFTDAVINWFHLSNVHCSNRWRS